MGGTGRSEGLRASKVKKKKKGLGGLRVEDLRFQGFRVWAFSVFQVLDHLGHTAMLTEFRSPGLGTARVRRVHSLMSKWDAHGRT